MCCIRSRHAAGRQVCSIFFFERAIIQDTTAPALQPRVIPHVIDKLVRCPFMLARLAAAFQANALFRHIFTFGNGTNGPLSKPPGSLQALHNHCPSLFSNSMPAFKPQTAHRMSLIGSHRDFLSSDYFTRTGTWPASESAPCGNMDRQRHFAVRVCHDSVYGASQ